MLPTDQFYRVTHTLDSSLVPRAANVVYCVQHTGVMTTGEVADAAHAAFAAGPATAMTTEWKLTQTHVKRGPDEDGPIHVKTGPDAVGTEAPPTATPQVAYLIEKQTGAGGRRGRGRMYLPGVKESYVGVAGALDSTATTVLQAQFDEWFAALDTATIPLHLEHDPATTWVLVNGQPRRVPTGAAPPNPSLVTAVTVDALVATQRRRMR